MNYIVKRIFEQSFWPCSSLVFLPSGSSKQLANAKLSQEVSGRVVFAEADLKVEGFALYREEVTFVKITGCF